MSQYELKVSEHLDDKTFYVYEHKVTGMKVVGCTYDAPNGILTSAKWVRPTMDVSE
jgi:hypothetical protein